MAFLKVCLYIVKHPLIESMLSEVFLSLSFTNLRVPSAFRKGSTMFRFIICFYTLSALLVGNAQAQDTIPSLSVHADCHSMSMNHGAKSHVKHNAMKSPAQPFVVSNSIPFADLMDQSEDIMNQGMAQAPMLGNPDHDFASMMIPHHQGAVDMAKVELLYGKDPAMRRLAQEIIVSQGSEIAVMQMSLKQFAETHTDNTSTGNHHD